ncbi:MAG: hypothetical protein JSS75_14100 [Bacteroidetes bacterium]|nr:hypothetical protein [Bacteroidota bacterium]
MVRIINTLTPDGIDQIVQGNDGIYNFTLQAGISAGMNVNTDQEIGELYFQGISLETVYSPCHGILQTVAPGAVNDGTVIATYTAAPAVPVASSAATAAGARRA